MSSKEELLLYLKKSQDSFEELLEAKILDEHGKKIPSRNLFVSLRKYATDFFQRGVHPRMIGIAGLRGVGKTTLMWQVADFVYHDLRQQNILALSGEDINVLGYRLYDLIQLLDEGALGEDLSLSKKPLMILIDEVHEMEEWSRDLKILYERSKHVFVLCTGSSALLMHKSPDLASRWTLKHLYPFSFPEFILAKSWLQNDRQPLFPIEGLGRDLREAILFSESFEELKQALQEIEEDALLYLRKAKQCLQRPVQALMKDYLLYYNIARFLKIEQREIIRENIISLFERILLKDVPGFLGESLSRDLMFRILLRLALSDKVSYQKLSRDFRLKEKEVEDLIGALGKAEVLNIFYPYGGIKTKAGARRKIFFMSPSLRFALAEMVMSPAMEGELYGKLYEDIVAMYLQRVLGSASSLISVGYEGDKRSPDFVVETRDTPFLVEVGTAKSSMVQLRRSTEMRYGLLLSAQAEKIVYDEKKKVIALPLSWWLLM